MLSDAIKEPHDPMVRPVRVSFFDPRTGEPCDHRPEPLRREKGRETVEERNAAIAKRERDEKEATRGAAGAHAQMDSPRTAAPSLVSVVK